MIPTDVFEQNLHLGTCYNNFYFIDQLDNCEILMIDLFLIFGYVISIRETQSLGHGDGMESTVTLIL